MLQTRVGLVKRKDRIRVVESTIYIYTHYLGWSLETQPFSIFKKPFDIIRCKKKSLKIETIFHVHSYNMCMFLKESWLGRCNGRFQLAAPPKNPTPRCWPFDMLINAVCTWWTQHLGGANICKTALQTKIRVSNQHQKNRGKKIEKKKHHNFFVASNLSRFQDDMFLNPVSCDQNEELFIEILALNR